MAPPALFTTILLAAFMVTVNSLPSAVVSVRRIALPLFAAEPSPSFCQLAGLFAPEVPEKFT
ncbi:hypothetical protein D3C72_2335910 [compost metagenome]